LRDVSLTIPQGTFLGIVGDNGAGKSTMLKILSGALSPDSGDLLADGRSVTMATPAAAKMLGIATVEFIFNHVDAIAVMRLGQCVAVRQVGDTTREEVIGFITGAISADSEPRAVS